MTTSAQRLVTEEAPPETENALHASPYGRQAARTDAIIDFPMEHVVRRYAADHDVPMDLAVEHEIELKRYFALTALNPTHDYGMSGPVDDLWHTFILFTKEYASFCENHIGRFLHHYPDRIYDGEPAGTNVETADTLEWYAVFLREYAAVFGQIPPAHIWPDVKGFPVTETTALCRVCGTDPRPDPPEPSSPGGGGWGW